MPKEFKAKLPLQWRDKLPLILYTANPIGPSVPFFRRHFVEPREPFSIEMVHGFLRQYIPSRAEDNLSVDLQAHKDRIGGMDDKAVAAAIDQGIWDTITGEFYPEWDEERHVVADFYPPHWWFRFRSYDWGTADPAVCYWAAISDGEPFKDSDGHERWFPRGAIVFYQELYFCDTEDPAKGARLSNEEMARSIINNSEGNAKKVPTLADSKPFQSMGGYGIAETFRDNGCPLTMADTSRVNGWAQLRARLRGVQIDSNDPARIPMVFFCECCKKARDYIPALPRHPSEAKKEDAAEHGEATHACDAIRYACMVHSIIKDCVVPLETRIAKEITRAKPTMKKILKRSGHAYFN